jgi:hypothetical protein
VLAELDWHPSKFGHPKTIAGHVLAEEREWAAAHAETTAAVK